ncbi:MAG: TonB-dependent receptor plug domain-containing protein [Melioribacteraceae bacterium]
MKIKFLNLFSLVIFFIFHSTNFSQSEFSTSDTTFIKNDTLSNFYFNKITKEQIKYAPIRETKDLLKLFPGLTTYQNKFHLRGSRSDEIAYTINGSPITDLFSGEQLLYIPLNIIDEVKLFSGSQPITISNSGSGIIDYKLKSGGDKLEFNFEQTSDNVGFNGTSNAFSGNERLGAYWYGYSESNLSIGGPVFNTPIKFFVNSNYKFMRDRNPQRYPGVDNLLLVDEFEFTHDSLLLNYPAGIVYGNSIQKYNIFGSLDFDFNPLKIKLMGIYDNQLQDVSRNNLQSFLNNRIGKNQKENIFISLTSEHKLSTILSYNFQASYTSNHEETYDPYLKDNYWAYGDSVANANVGIVWERSELDRYFYSSLTPQQTRYIAGGSFNFYGFIFDKNGKPTVNYSKLNQEQFSVATSLDINYFKNHSIKIGGGFTHSVLRKWRTLRYQRYLAGSLARAISQNQELTEQEIKERILLYSGINIYGYDIFGDKTSKGYNAPHKPKFANIYLQDIITYENFLIELGLRYDYLNNDYLLFKDENDFYKSYNYSKNVKNIFTSDAFVKSQSYSYLSPHIFITYKPTPKIILQTSLQQNVKQSKFYNTYDSPYLYFHAGSDLITFKEGLGFNNDIKPTITQQLSQSYTQIISKYFSYNIEAFYKKIKNQPIAKLIISERQTTHDSYPKIMNDGISEIMGIDFRFNVREFFGFSLYSSLSLLSAKGTIQRNPPTFEDRPYTYINASLDFEKQLSSNLFISYNFSQLNKTSSILDNLNLTALLTYSSGHPYTLSSGGRILETDTRFRTPLNNQYNEQTTPSNFQLNLRIDKTIEIYNNVNLNFYIYAINILNNENILDVFLRTGSAKTDGYLENTDLGGKLIEVFGENYAKLYKLINIQYNPRGGQQNMYGEPRQIIMGIKLNL